MGIVCKRNDNFVDKFMAYKRHIKVLYNKFLIILICVCMQISTIYKKIKFVSLNKLNNNYKMSTDQLKKVKILKTKFKSPRSLCINAKTNFLFEKTKI